MIRKIGLQGYVDFVGGGGFCVKGLLLDMLSFFGEGVLFTYKEIGNWVLKILTKPPLMFKRDRIEKKTW